MKRSRPTSQLTLTWYRFRRNKAAILGLVIVSLEIFAALTADLIAPYDPEDTSGFFRGEAYLPPCYEHFFGTDKMARDLFSMIIYGARTALYVGVGASLIGLLIGIPIGAFAGYLGGKVDEILMRVTEAFMVVPVFLFVLFLFRVLTFVLVRFNLEALIFTLGIFGWPPLARLVRAQFLKIKELEYVEASKCLGASTRRIMFRHIFPNSLPPVLAAVTLRTATFIMSEASITFLGFGDPTMITWGRILTLAQDTLMEAWWTALFPGLAIFLTVLGFNLLGDGLSDALNPRLRE